MSDREKDDSIAVITPRGIGELKELSTLLAPSAMLPEALRGKPGDVMATIMTGAELGLLPMQSVRAIDMVKGRPTLKAEAQVALVRRRKDVCEYFRLVESSDRVAIYETRRAGDPGPTRLSFSIEQAQRAGLTGNPTWAKHPEAMLRARCSSALCRTVYSDLLLGIYDPDEVSDRSTPSLAAPASVGEVVDAQFRAEQPPPAPSTSPSSIPAPTPAPTPAPAPSPQPVEVEVQNVEQVGKIADALRRIEAATGMVELIAISQEFRSWSREEKDAVRPAYAAAKARLGGAK